MPHRTVHHTVACTQCAFLALICVLLVCIDSVKYSYAKIIITVMFDCVIFDSMTFIIKKWQSLQVSKFSKH